MDVRTSRHHEVYARWQRDPQAFWGEAAQDGCSALGCGRQVSLTKFLPHAERGGPSLNLLCKLGPGHHAPHPHRLGPHFRLTTANSRLLPTGRDRAKAALSCGNDLNDGPGVPSLRLLRAPPTPPD